jgi:hypothetical protein
LESRQEAALFFYSPGCLEGVFSETSRHKKGRSCLTPRPPHLYSYTVALEQPHHVALRV